MGTSIKDKEGKILQIFRGNEDPNDRVETIIHNLIPKIFESDGFTDYYVDMLLLALFNHVQEFEPTLATQQSLVKIEELRLWFKAIEEY